MESDGVSSTRISCGYGEVGVDLLKNSRMKGDQDVLITLDENTTIVMTLEQANQLREYLPVLSDDGEIIKW